MTICNSCGEEVEDFREHLTEKRAEEWLLGQTDPRGRIFLALSGHDHDVTTPDVSRVALGR